MAAHAWLKSLRWMKSAKTSWVGSNTAAHPRGHSKQEYWPQHTHIFSIGTLMICPRKNVDPTSSLISVYTVCHSICISWKHYSVVNHTVQVLGELQHCSSPELIVYQLSVFVVVHTFELEYLLMPVGQSWSNFMCSIIGVGERLHKVLGQIWSKLVSMATESAHWLIMGKTMSPFLCCFWSDLLQTCR